MTDKYAVDHSLRRVHVLDQIFGDSHAQAARPAVMQPGTGEDPGEGPHFGPFGPEVDDTHDAANNDPHARVMRAYIGDNVKSLIQEE